MGGNICAWKDREGKIEFFPQFVNSAWIRPAGFLFRALRFSPMKKEELMIVGAGKFQVPIIELAKQMGFETMVVSIAGN
jgi:D-arabinose 1-dehydrogenase-like Zn-dependent alcohol dehydrogenase